MEAGIFFDYDPVTQVLLPDRWRPQAQPRARLHMLLWVRPHVAHLRADILRVFVEKDHNNRRDPDLDHLMTFMTREQRESLVVDAALMLDRLDYDCLGLALSEVGNAALDIFSAAGRMPDQVVAEVFMMGCCKERDGIYDTSMQSYRRWTFGTLRVCADRGVLTDVLARRVAAKAIVDCFKHMSDSEELEYGSDGVSSLFKLLSEVECILQKGDLIKVGNALVHVTRKYVLDFEEEEFGPEWDTYALAAFDEYRKLCKRCLPAAEALEVWQKVAWCYECMDMYNEDWGSVRDSDSDGDAEE